MLANIRFTFMDNTCLKSTSLSVISGSQWMDIMVPMFQIGLEFLAILNVP